MASAPAHDGLYAGIGLDAFKQLDFHACFLQVADRAVEESEALHRAAADADDGLLPVKVFSASSERPCRDTNRGEE